jgi:predicted kinase
VNNIPKGVLILISGPALAGKSTFLDALKSSLSSLHIVSTDDIRDEFFHSFDYVIENEPFIWKTAYQRLHDHLNLGHMVCLDATLRTPTHREEIRTLFQHNPIVYFAFENPPLEVLLKRNQERTWKQFPEDAIRRMHQDYQFPSIEEQSMYAFFAPIPYPSNPSILQSLLPKLMKSFF